MGRERKRVPTADRRYALWRVANIIDGGHWCALDVETTGRGFDDQVVEGGVCGPDLVARSWRMRPTVPITPETTALHGRTDAEIWPSILAHIAGRKTVMYNTKFDYGMLSQSARAFGLRAPAIWQGQCVMTWYAAVHGEPRGLYEYKYQPLQTACQCLEIPLPQGGQLPSAATDATLAAQIMLRLADIHHQEQARLTPAPISHV